MKVENAILKAPGLIAVALSAMLVTTTYAQSDDGRNKNNPYSPSPAATAFQASAKAPTPVNPKAEPTKSVEPPVERIAFVVNDSRPKVSEQPTAAAKAINIAPTLAEKPVRSSTDVYLIAPGDVLFINLKNSPQGTGRYTVRNDGTIDYALAGANVVVKGHTCASVEATLHRAIKLYEDPQVEVKVQDYGSHAIVVSGLVNNPGEKNLRREAMPLYALKVESEVRREAATVSITRSGTWKTESHELALPATDNLLIYPGDSVVFAAKQIEAKVAYYYINGEVASSGRRELTNGLRLAKAITLAGAKAEAKKIVIKRPSENGVTTLEYDLRSVKSGKIADPIITPGDIIEVKI